MAPRSRGRGLELTPPEDGYPWEDHERALHHLARLEVLEAREAISAMLPAIQAIPPEQARAAGLLAWDLIGQARALLAPPGEPDPTSRTTRWAEAIAFAQAEGGERIAALMQAALASSLELYRHAPVNPLVQRARDFIEQNYSRKLSLRHVAEYLNVSRNYLSGLFRKECGCTITDFIHQTRVRRAQSLLMAGGQTVSEIAYQVGYQNYRDFYRNFVKHGNSSPTRYRLLRAADPGAASA